MGYRLTDLGEVTIDFLFNTYIPYELTPFVILDRYLTDTRVRAGRLNNSFGYGGLLF